MRAVFVGLVALVSASSVTAMPVSTFIDKANALKAKGPFALLSSDYGLLKNEVVTSMTALRNERLAAVKAGSKPAYCPTQASGQMDVDEVLGAMNAVPAPLRPRTAVKDALLQHLAQRFPCRT
jgi:hypothetical protein